MLDSLPCPVLKLATRGLSHKALKVKVLAFWPFLKDLDAIKLSKRWQKVPKGGWRPSGQREGGPWRSVGLNHKSGSLFSGTDNVTSLWVRIRWTFLQNFKCLWNLPLKVVPDGPFWFHEPWTGNFKTLNRIFIVDEPHSLTMKVTVMIWNSRFMIHEVKKDRLGPP